MPAVKHVIVPKFRYPHEGSYLESDTIVVCEPTFAQRRIYTRVKHAVVRALTGRSTGSKESGADQSEPEAEAEGNPADIPPETVLNILMGGFEDGEAWEQFYMATRRALSDHRDLAHVDGTQAKITDEIWNGIGLQAEERVIANFLHFFWIDVTTTFQNVSGSETSTQSSISTAAELPTQKHATFHDPNLGRR